MNEPKDKLLAGEHYGSVFHKCRTATAVISESVYPCSLCLPEHAHELGFFTLILDGYYSEIINGRTVTYSPRTVLWRQAELSHKDRIEAGRSRFFFVEIHGESARSVDDYERIPAHLAERGGLLADITDRLRAEVIACDPRSESIVDGLTLELLGALATKGCAPEWHRPRWLSKVVDRLHGDITAEPTNGELAAEAGVHPVHLATVFRRFHHQTIGDYVQQLRVERAIDLLKRRSLSLTDIAYECGFADQPHFTRTFKRRMGLTPGAFRSSIA